MGNKAYGLGFHAGKEAIKRGNFLLGATLLVGGVAIGLAGRYLFDKATAETKPPENPENKQAQKELSDIEYSVDDSLT